MNEGSLVEPGFGCLRLLIISYLRSLVDGLVIIFLIDGDVEDVDLVVDRVVDIFLFLLYVLFRVAVGWLILFESVLKIIVFFAHFLDYI